MSELTEHLRHIGCLNKPRCIEAADLLDAQATELARLRKQEPVAYVSIIDDDKPRSDIIDRELPPLTPLYAAPIPPTPTPTPSQEEANREASLYRWWKKNREVTLITAIYGNGCVNKTLADVEAFILARPDEVTK